MSRKKQTGLTLVELACTTAILGSLLSAALPSADSVLQRKRLEAVAQTLRTDLQEVRSTSIQRNVNLLVHFETSSQGTCYIVHSGAEGSCRCDAKSHEARCDAPHQAIKTQWLPASQHITLSGGKDIRFAAGQGTVTPTATLTLSNERGGTIQTFIGIAGRVRN